MGVHLEAVCSLLSSFSLALVGRPWSVLLVRFSRWDLNWFSCSAVDVLVKLEQAQGSVRENKNLIVKEHV